MRQHRRRCRLCLKHDARVLGTCLSDQFTELCGLLRSGVSSVIDHHQACRLENLQERAETIIVRMGQVHEYGPDRSSPAQVLKTPELRAAEHLRRKTARLLPTAGFSTHYDARHDIPESIIRNIAYRKRRIA